MRPPVAWKNGIDANNGEHQLELLQLLAAYRPRTIVFTIDTHHWVAAPGSEGQETMELLNEDALNFTIPIVEAQVENGDFVIFRAPWRSSF